MICRLDKNKKVFLYLVICAFTWILMEQDAIKIESEYIKIYSLIGCWRGYRFPVVTAMVYVTLFIVFISKELCIYSMEWMIRIKKEIIMKKVISKLFVYAIKYSLVYVGVNMIFLIFIFGVDILIKLRIFEITFFYWMSTVIVYIFGGITYVLIYVYTKKDIVSIILAGALNLIMAYICDEKILYGGLYIVDESLFLNKINIAQWIFYALVSLSIIWVIRIIMEEIYKKVDVV